MLAIAINLVLLSVNSAILPCFLASASAIALAYLSLLASASLLSSIAHTSLPSSLRASAERVHLRVQQTRLYRNWFNYSAIRLLLRVRLTHSHAVLGAPKFHHYPLLRMCMDLSMLALAPNMVAVWLLCRFSPNQTKDSQQ